MIKIGRGAIAPANLDDIIHDLFENEKQKQQDGGIRYWVFSLVTLSSEQKKALEYPSEVVPCDMFIVYQMDKIDKNNDITETKISLISFVKKNDGYIYGYYFYVDNQPRFYAKKLIMFPYPLSFDKMATFRPMNYIEVYNNVLGTIVILGLNTNEINIASLQFSHNSKYFYEDLQINGISDPLIPKTKLIGLSKNLKNYKKHKHNSN